MKKKLKIFIAVIVVLVAILIIIPIVFEGKIIELVKKNINNNVNATFNFDGADLSLWSSYPNAEVTLKNISLLNHAPFQGDTLFSAKEVSLKFPFKELFKNSSETIHVSSFVLNKSNISIKIDEQGNANYDIAKETGEKDGSTAEEPNTFQLGLENYKIIDSKITYYDSSSKTNLKLTGFNHSGAGNLSLEKSELKTITSTLVSFAMDSISYLNKNQIQLDAVLGIDLKENKYSFLDNKLLINQLPLVFDGFIKLNENNQEVDLSFKTPSSDFKNFLALIPEVYSKNIEGVKTTGNFDVKGKINGVIDEEHIPKFQITINSDNASFKYPDLSESLQDINIKTEITNKTGLIKDTYVIIDKLSFKINKDAFSATAKLMEVTKNMKVDASLKGILNLANLEKVYPAESVKGLKGILNIDAATRFDMESIEKEQYQNTKTLGDFQLTNFEYNSTELSSPLKITKTAITFNPKTVVLNSFDAQLGKTDLIASGIINNLLGFLFNEENIGGKFKITSDTFSVNDFMVAEVRTDNKEEKNSAIEEQIKIPSFLDCTIDAKVNTVLYDDITLKNVSGTLFVKDEKAELKNMKSNVFGGKLGFNGVVSTKEKTPTFQMDLDINNFNIAKSFKTLDLLNGLVPIADVVDGKLNSKINLSGNLNDDFTPDLNSLTGSLLGKLLSSKVSTKNSILLQKLEQNMSFLDLEKLNLDDIKASISFKEGKIVFNPFTLKYDDIEIDISGEHGFDTSLVYDVVVNIPAKYLGKEAVNLLNQLDEKQQNTIIVPLGVSISGKLKNPTIKTDFKSAITNLSKQVINNQKDKLINEGEEKVKGLLDDLFNDKNGDKKADSTSTDDKPTQEAAIKKAANDVLGNLFGKKKDTAN